jgi:dienelactone hydrolase
VLGVELTMSEHETAYRIDSRNSRYKHQLEDYFRGVLVEEYPERAASAWSRDYSSLEAYEASVAGMRERWRELLNPPRLTPSGVLRAEVLELPGVRRAWWLRAPLGRIDAEAIVAVPDGDGGPWPLVIAQHGIGSAPETVFGVRDERCLYHAYGKALVDGGYAVLAPFNLAHSDPRGRITRLAHLGRTTLFGLELARVQHLLDLLLDPAERRWDLDARRIAMWGLSLGGLATQLWTPLEPRIRVAIDAAFFNHRPNKMAIPDPRYSCFLDTAEEHAFLPGWLTAFSDEDLLSLVCPRPLQVQHGEADGIAWWPQVEEAFARLRDHYRRLGIEERVSLDLHTGGHEIRLEAGLAFLSRFL